MNRYLLAILLLTIAGCTRPGHEPLVRFDDPKGQFSVLLPKDWPLDGNYAQAAPISPIRWVEATGRVEAVDEESKLGVSFKVARFPLDRAEFHGDAAAYARFQKEVLDPKTAPFIGATAGGATVAGFPSVSRTSSFEHRNGAHMPAAVAMRARTVLVKGAKAVYQIELIALEKRFDQYQPMFEQSLAGFTVLEK